MKSSKVWAGIGIAVAALTIIACGTSGSTGSGKSSGDKVAQDSKSTAASAAAKSPAASGKKNDKGWVLESDIVKADGLGGFGGSARITNTNADANTATFTITVFKAGKQVASLQGSADQVNQGKTVTVDLISSNDKYVAGPYTIDFQTDTSF